MKYAVHIGTWLLACCLLTAPAQGQDELDDATRATVRRLADEGGHLYQDGKYAEALEKLERAYSIYPVPSIGYYSARCLQELGRWVEASERYVEVTRLEVPSTAAEVHRKAQGDSIEARRELAPRIPRLQVTVKGAAPDDVVIKVDDVPLRPAMVGLARPADPGEHVIVANRWGDVIEQRIIVEEGGSNTIELVFDPRDPPPPPVSPEEANDVRVTSYVLMGLGGAGMLAGGITGTILLTQEVQLGDRCAGDRCTPSSSSSVDLANSMRLPTTIALAAGGGVFVTGLLMYYLGPSSPADDPSNDEVSIAPLVGPGFIGLSGQF